MTRLEQFPKVRAALRLANQRKTSCSNSPLKYKCWKWLECFSKMLLKLCLVKKVGRPVFCNVKRFHNTAVWDCCNIRLHVLDKLWMTDDSGRYWRLFTTISSGRSSKPVSTKTCRVTMILSLYHDDSGVKIACKLSPPHWQRVLVALIWETHTASTIINWSKQWIPIIGE